MSLTESPIPEKRSELKYTQALPMLSLNDILRESMEPLHLHQDMVVRCEHLPHVKGQKEELVRLFTMLMRLIISQKQSWTKLFLYVNCDEGKKDSLLEPGFKNYIIKIHTNISTSDAWKEMNDHILCGCEKIVHSHSGVLQVNNIYNTGCLFAISLAGKFA